MEGSTVKKEARIEVEMSEKIWGYVAGVGEFENEGQKPQGPRERAQKFWKIIFLKILQKRMFWKYVLSSCHRGVWYEMLRNVKIEQQ